MLWNSRPYFAILLCIVLLMALDTGAQDIQADDPSMAVLDAEEPAAPATQQAEVPTAESPHQDNASPALPDIANIHALKTGSDDHPPGSQDFSASW